MNFGCMKLLIGTRLYVCSELSLIPALSNSPTTHLNNYLITEPRVITHPPRYAVVFRCSIVIDRHALLICEPVILPFDSKSTRKYLKQNIADVLKAKLLTLERHEPDN